MVVPLAHGAEGGNNMLTNGDFAQETDGKPASWTVLDAGQKVSTEKVDDRTTLRIEIVKDGGKSLGEIRQTIKVSPNQTYRISGDIKSTKPGAALISIKTRAKRKELHRFATAASTPEWQTVTKDFDSGDADEVQVLCRYKMSADAVGAVAWFSNLVLVPIDANGNPMAVAPKEPAQKKAIEPVIAPAGEDQYVLPTAAGDGSGKDFANARGVDSLQAALDAAGPGNVVRVGSGTYHNVALKFTSGGSGPEARKRLIGVDTGGGLPVFTSDFDPKNPAKTGRTFMQVSAGVSYIEVGDVILNDYRMGVVLNGGGNTGVLIRNVDVNRCRDAFIFDGEAIRDLVVRDCDVNQYTKRAVRITRGVSDAQIINVRADAGGKAYAHEVFPVGFHVVQGERITFIDCVSNNNWHDAGSDRYWNADGYAAERDTKDLTYIRCSAAGNTDGGWDLKTTGIKLVDCVSIANKRNYRFWAASQPTVLENCLSAYSHDYGNRGHDVGLWQQGGGLLEVKNCTLWGDRVALSVENGTEEKPTFVKLDHCLVATSEGGTVERLSPGVKLEETESVIVRNPASQKVELRRPTRDWKGGDDAFDAVSHVGVGYRAKPLQQSSSQ